MARIRRMLLCCSLSGAPIFSPCPGPHPPVAHILAHSTNSPPLSEPHPPYISPSLRSFSPTLPLSHFSCLRTIKLTCQRARAVERACSRGFRGGAVQDWKIHAGCVGKPHNDRKVGDRAPLERKQRVCLEMHAPIAAQQSEQSTPLTQ
eukprot:2071988-Rhodomonas_salina.2